MEGLRNNFVWWVCNILINYVAVGQYRDYLRTVYAMGRERFEEEFWRIYDEMQAAERKDDDVSM